MAEMRTFMQDLAVRLDRPDLSPALIAQPEPPVTQPEARPARAVSEINGATELSFVEGYLDRHVLWPSAADLDTACLVVAAYHAKAPYELDNGVELMAPVWPWMFRVWIGSNKGGAGKSHAGKMIGSLCPKHMMLVRHTEPSLISLMGQQATIQITEANLKLTRRLIALVNAGYERGPASTRRDHGRDITTPLFGPVILDGLNYWLNEPDPDRATLASRCIRINMERAPDGYRPPRIGLVEQAAAAQISRRMAAWMGQEVDNSIGFVVPELPAELDPRRASLWEPIMACALRAGDTWPQRAWDACLQLECRVPAPTATKAAGAEEQNLQDLMAQWRKERDSTRVTEAARD